MLHTGVCQVSMLSRGAVSTENLVLLLGWLRMRFLENDDAVISPQPSKN